MMQIFNESGKGYWMEGCGCLRAEGENRPSRPNHVVAVFCDMYNFAITGDVSANLNAASCDSPTHSGPSLLILNDQGGSIMDVSEEVSACLRAQEHGHQPVVCFEPGIMRRDCSAGNRAYMDVCSTLRAQMGDNQPAVCYAIDHVVTTGGNCTAQGPCWYKDICPTEKASGVHAVCYAIDQQGGKGGANWMKDTMCTLCSDSHGTPHAVCYEAEHG